MRTFTRHILNSGTRTAADLGAGQSRVITFAGLKRQAELNIDVVDTVSTQQLADWFSARWADRWSIDITLELAQIIDESWAGEQGHTPYEIYLKMAYHR